MISTRSACVWAVLGILRLCSCAYDVIDRPFVNISSIPDQTMFGESEVKNTSCKMIISSRSIKYFRSRLEVDQPNFIHFRLSFYKDNVPYRPNFTHDIIYPFKWFWTYRSNRGLYPYLKWNPDFNVLSFDLLDTKTLRGEPYIIFYVSGDCHLTLGRMETTDMIAGQLTTLVSNLSIDNDIITPYEDSYWCFMAEKPGFHNSVANYMGQYLLYQPSVLNYNCCYTYYDYLKSGYRYNCTNEEIKKWIQCTDGPYILGMIVFLYSPIILFMVAAEVTKRDKVTSGESRTFDKGSPLAFAEETCSESVTDETEDDIDWLYLDGDVPKSFFEPLTSLLPAEHPIAVSRLKRLLFVLLGPSIVYIQVWMYSRKMPEIIAEAAARGIPVGFLSLLANTTDDRKRGFVPALGGPYSLLSCYYLSGIAFLVLPRSVQDVIENGIPRGNSHNTPLSLSISEIQRFSGINVLDRPGYKRAENMFLCSFYMLFRVEFWITLIEIQQYRFFNISNYQSKVCRSLILVILPVYITICLMEVVICIVYFSIPLCGFFVTIVRGAVRTIAFTIHGRRHMSNGRFLSILFNTGPVIAVFSIVVAAAFMYFMYSFCLVFMQSFFFLSQIVVYCYMAVIVYPTVSLGYLVFVVMMAYYIFRLIRGFGGKYLVLLNDIVEIATRTEDQDNYATEYDGTLSISNVKVSGIRSIQINDINLNIAQNVLQRIQIQKKSVRKLNLKNNTYGIPKKLFDHVVQKHLPVRPEALNVLFKLCAIVLFLTITISLTDKFLRGPTSEISDVMHVMFIVSVGAMPRVLEVALEGSSEHIYRDIKLRHLEDTIKDYWRIQEEGNGEKATRTYSNSCSDLEIPGRSIDD